MAKKIKYSNAYDDPKAIRSKNFAHGIIGLGMAPWESQTETMIAHKIVLNFVKKRKKGYECIHHISIDKKGLKIPDVSFWELKNGYPQTPLVVIEIDNHAAQSIAAKKCKDAISNHGIKEAFVYVSDTGKWRRFTKRGESKLRKSYSITLKLGLSKLLPEKKAKRSTL